MGVINVSVLPHNLGKLTASFLDNFLSGLITTVAQRNPVLNWYSLVAYCVYLLLFLWNLWVGKNRRVLQIGGLVLLSIFFNVGLVSLVIFCQTRYTIYNMALFYIALILMLNEWWKARSFSGRFARSALDRPER